MADLPRAVDKSKVEAPSTASLRSIGHERCHIGMSMISVDVNLIDARYYRVLLGRGQPGVRFGPHFVVVVNVISLGSASEGAQGSQVAVLYSRIEVMNRGTNIVPRNTASASVGVNHCASWVGACSDGAAGAGGEVAS